MRCCRSSVAIPEQVALKTHTLNQTMKNKIAAFLNRGEIRDFKVKLGSILEAEVREYYVEQRFSYLKEKLSSTIIKAKP